MNKPGVWILGATDDHDRTAGMGIVVEYSQKSGDARWTEPSKEAWDYTVFGTAPAARPEAERVNLVFEKKFAGSRWIDKWTINGKSFPENDDILVKANRRYRLVFDNRSDEAHPVHLHRHTFELTRVGGVSTSAYSKMLSSCNRNRQSRRICSPTIPALTLFHCHQQMHMDYGFMALMRYVS